MKISGQRVELGAVENAVLSCPGIQGCAVIVVDGGGAGSPKSLAAFAVVVGQNDVDDGAAETKATLEKIAEISEFFIFKL